MLLLILLISFFGASPPNSLQRYNFFFIYANKKAKIIVLQEVKFDLQGVKSRSGKIVQKAAKKARKWQLKIKKAAFLTLF